MYYFFKIWYFPQSSDFKITNIEGKESKKSFYGHLKFTVSDSEAYKIYDKQKALSVLAYMVKHPNKLGLRGKSLFSIILVRCIDDSMYERVMTLNM